MGIGDSSFGVYVIMKISVLGKGGSGKSTVTTIIARSISQQGFKVLVVDTDESNLGLHRQLGLPQPKELMEQLGGRTEIGKKIKAAFNNTDKDIAAEIMQRRWTIEDIPEECRVSDGKVSLMHIGKVKHFGEGCACPMGVLSRSFLEYLDLKDDEVAIVDTEAGVEHIGRGVERFTDLILMVIDPSFESIRLSEHITQMLEKAGKEVHFVLNKIESDDLEFVRRLVDENRIVSVLPMDRDVRSAGLSGNATPIELNGASALIDFILVEIKQSKG